MHNWYYDFPTNPSGLASLPDRHRSERAAWRAAIRQALTAKSAEPQSARAPTKRSVPLSIEPLPIEPSSTDSPVTDSLVAGSTVGSVAPEPVLTAC